MAFSDGGKKELQQEVGIIISKDFPLSATTLASMESLSLPLVQEVVLSADMQCDECQKRVADIITKMNGGPCCLPLRSSPACGFGRKLGETVIAETESHSSAETESIVVDVLEKTVTLTFRLSRVGRVTSHQITPMNRTLLPKAAIIKRLFRSSHR